MRHLSELTGGKISKFQVETHACDGIEILAPEYSLLTVELSRELTSLSVRDSDIIVEPLGRLWSVREHPPYSEDYGAFWHPVRPIVARLDAR